MALEKETTAPTFTLNRKTEDGITKISLADSFGKESVVLLFFPFAFTSVCQEELCSVSAGMDQYSELDAVVYGISTDSPFAQEAFAKSAGISIPLLSDYNQEVTKAYDVAYEELLGYEGVSKRSAFVINKEGLVSFSWSSDDPKQLPPFDEIKTALKV